MKLTRYFILFSFVFVVSNLIGQENKVDIQIYFHSVLKDQHNKITNGGAFALQYQLLDKEKVRIGIQTEIGAFINTNKLVNYNFSAFLNYNFSFTKRLSAGYLLGPALIFTDWQYLEGLCGTGLGDGSLADYYIVPHFGAYVEYQMFQNSLFQISGIIRAETIRLDKNYSRKWNEGFKFGYSTGLAFRFLK